MGEERGGDAEAELGGAVGVDVGLRFLGPPHLCSSPVYGGAVGWRRGAWQAWVLCARDCHTTWLRHQSCVARPTRAARTRATSCVAPLFAG